MRGEEPHSLRSGGSRGACWVVAVGVRCQCGTRTSLTRAPTTPAPPQTTGALAPAEIVSSALTVLREKLDMVQAACSAILAGTGGLGITVSALPLS